MKRWIALSLFCALLSPAAATAQTFPTRPVTFVVTYPAGASTNDIIARALAPHLAQKWGQQVLVDNRPGANGIIGTDLVAKAPPDGHTIVLGTDASMAINPSLYPTLPYDPIKDFAPVAFLAHSQLILVTTKANSLAELIADAGAHPGKINYGSVGIGSQHHLAMEWLKSLSHTDMVHITYKGAAPALVAMMSGEISAMWAGPAPVREYVATGKVKAIAASDATRSPMLPNVPTVAESGYPDFKLAIWFGILAPAKTPPAIVKKMHDDFTAVLQIPEVQQSFAKQGIEPAPMTSAEFGKFIQDEKTRWAKVVKISGATLTN